MNNKEKDLTYYNKKLQFLNKRCKGQKLQKKVLQRINSFKLAIYKIKFNQKI